MRPEKRSSLCRTNAQQLIRGEERFPLQLYSLSEHPIYRRLGVWNVRETQLNYVINWSETVKRPNEADCFCSFKDRLLYSAAGLRCCQRNNKSWSSHLAGFPLQNDFHLETNLLISLFSSIHPSIVSSFQFCILLSFPYPLISNPSLVLQLVAHDGCSCIRFLHNPKHFRKYNSNLGLSFGGLVVEDKSLALACCLSHCFLHQSRFCTYQDKIKRRHLEVRGVIHKKSPPGTLAGCF